MKLKRLILLTGLFLVPLPIFASTPAGTVIRAQASAEFDWDGHTYSVNSNTVSTLVLPVYAFDVSPDGSVPDPGQVRHAFPGNTVYLNYILINHGNVEDSYYLTSILVGGSFEPYRRAIYWDINRNGVLDPGEDVPINYLGNIEPEDPVYLILTVDVPPVTHEGDSVFINIVAQSANDTTLIDSNNIAFIEVLSGAVMSATKSAMPSGAVNPNDTVAFTINFINSGMASADTVIVTDWIGRNGSLPYVTYLPHSFQTQPSAQLYYYRNSTNEWVTQEPDDPGDVGGLRAIFFDISPGQNGYFRFSVTIDPDAPETVITNLGYIYYHVAGSNAGYELVTNNTINNIRYEPVVHIGPFNNSRALPGGEGSEDDIQSVDTVTAGRWVYFRNTILNAGPGDALVEIGYDTTGSGFPEGTVVELTAANFGEPLYDSDGDGLVDIGPLNEDDSIHIGVRIFVPSELNDTVYHPLTVFVFPQGIEDHRNITVNRFKLVSEPLPVSISLGKTVLPDTFVYSNTPLRFTIDFVNTGQVPLTAFNIYDVLDTVLTDVHGITSGAIPNLDDPSDSVVVAAMYDSTIRLIRWRIDTLPPGFHGQVSFTASISPDSGVSEGYLYNIASAISSEMQFADTSNRVAVHFVVPALDIKKSVDRASAELGDVVRFAVSVTNNTPGGEALHDIVVTDTLPVGLRVVEGSVRLEGESHIDSVKLSHGNRILEVYLDSLESGAHVRISYLAAVGPGAKPDRLWNRAYAVGYLPTNSPMRAGPAKACVDVREGFATTRGFIFGKVFIDRNDNRVQDPGEPGVPDIGIQTDDGIYVLTDSAGRYHIPSLSPGPHILRIDPHTIPENVSAPPTSIDFMNDGFVQLVDLKPSSNLKANFRLIPHESVVRKYRDFELRKTALPGFETFKFHVRLPSTYFETAKAELKPDAPMEKFKEIAEFVKAHKGWKLLIEGHTDSRPIHTREFPDNYALSLARANTVKKVFVKYGVPDSLIEIKGYGPDRPIVPNTTPGFMALNRRVDVTLLPENAKELSDVVRYKLTLRVNKKFDKELWIVDRLPEGAELVKDSVQSSIENMKYIAGDSLIVFYIPHLSDTQDVELSYLVRVKDASTASQFVNLAAPVVKFGDSYRFLAPVSTTENLEAADRFKEIVIKFPNNILFKTAKAYLRPGAEVLLRDVLELLKRYPDATCEISGHTDPRPIHTKRFPSNWELSEARAKSVYDWLVAHGIDSSRLSYKGYAYTKPIVPNTSLYNMQLNRRVEIVIKRHGTARPAPPSEDSAVTRMAILNVSMPFARFMDTVRVKDKMPEGFVYVPNSAFAAGYPIGDPEIDSNGLTFTIPPELTRKLPDEFELRYLMSKRKASVDTVAAQLRSLLSLVKSSYPDIVEPSQDTVVADNAMRVKVGSVYRMPVELYVNGERISDKNLGLHKTDPAHGIEEREFVGLRLKPGKNIIRLKTVDEHGKIMEFKRMVYVPGAPAGIKLHFDKKPVADGHTSPVLVASVLDSAGFEVGDNIEVTFDWEGVEVVSEDDRPATPGLQKLTVKGRAEIKLAPSAAPISGRVIAYLNDSLSDTIDVFYAPHAGGLDIFGGFDIRGKYVVEDRSVGLNPFVGLLVKGTVLKNYVVTATYRHNGLYDEFFTDNDREFLRNAYANVSTFTMYPTYGDASRIQRTTASRNGFFLRVDRGRSFIQYGDFKGSIGGKSIAVYQRALTGGVFHLENRYFEFNGFVAPDSQSLEKDEFRADGTAGYFYLSHTPIVRNSEEVYVISRDRFHPDIILKTTKLKPFIDYTLDPLTGTLLLNEPVASYDYDFNPQYIVVIYEVKTGNGSVTYASSMALKLSRNGRIGVMYGHSSHGEARYSTIMGVFSEFNIGKWLKFSMEVAQSDSNKSVGRAYSGSIILRPSNKFSINAKYTSRDSSFSNSGGLSSGGAAGAVSTEAKFSLTKTLSVEGRGEYKQVGRKRNYRGAEFLIRKIFGRLLSLGIGYKHADEKRDSVTQSLNAGVAMLRASIGRRFTLDVRHEQLVHDADFTINPPRSQVRAGFAITKYATLKGSFEHRWGGFGGNTAIAGLEVSPSRYLSTYTKYRFEDIGNSQHNQAVIGMRNNVPITKHLSASFNSEYIRDVEYPNLNHLAVAGGVEYRGRGVFSFKTGFEFKDAEKKNLTQLSLIMPVATGVGLVANERLHFVMKQRGGNMRVYDGYIGVAVRPQKSDKFNGFFVLRHYFTTDTSSRMPDKMILYSDFNYQPFYPFTISLRYGVKWQPRDDFNLITHLFSIWMRWELMKDRFYLAAGNKVLYQPLVNASESDLSFELGVVPIRRFILGIGYNLYGLSDSGFSEFEQTRRGFYLRIGGKFTSYLNGGM